MAMDFAYTRFHGCTEATEQEIDAYIHSVETNVLPDLDIFLKAKADGAQAASVKIIF